MPPDPPRMEWEQLDRGLYQTTDEQWRIAQPWRLSTELRHRYAVAERSTRGTGTSWIAHQATHTTLSDAKRYIESIMKMRAAQGVTSDAGR